jgi:hypothetical protein
MVTTAHFGELVFASRHVEAVTQTVGPFLRAYEQYAKSEAGDMEIDLRLSVPDLMKHGCACYSALRNPVFPYAHPIYATRAFSDLKSLSSVLLSSLVVKHLDTSQKEQLLAYLSLLMVETEGDEVKQVSKNMRSLYDQICGDEKALAARFLADATVVRVRLFRSSVTEMIRTRLMNQMRRYMEGPGLYPAGVDLEVIHRVARSIMDKETLERTIKLVSKDARMKSLPILWVLKYCPSILKFM